VICGTTDWLLFERLDQTQTLIVDAAEQFRFWFGGLQKKQTVAVCINCSIAARMPSWDARIAHRVNNPPPINTVTSFTTYQYYRRLISEQTLTAQEARGICEKPPYPVACENRRHKLILKHLFATFAHVIHRMFTGGRSHSLDLLSASNGDLRRLGNDERNLSRIAGRRPVRAE
jgi:hypothetical protein